jgi:peptide/nickel transport system ATP-binding protein
MHAGHIVEIAPTVDLLSRPAHPYTRQLLASTPTPRTTIHDLVSIPGQLPDLRKDLPACRFSARCERHVALCDERPLPWTVISPGHAVRCRVPL